MSVTQAQDLRAVYLKVVELGSADVSDVADALKHNARYSRELLGTLVQHGLLANPQDETTVYEPATAPFESAALAFNDRSAVEVIDAFIKATFAEAPQTPRNATGPATPRTRPAKGSPNSCRCDCGASTRGLYAPGHDARHAGIVARQLAEWTIQGEASGATQEVIDALVETLPSESLREKAYSHAKRLIEKASTKKQPQDHRPKSTPVPDPDGDSDIGDRMGLGPVPERVEFVYGTVYVGRWQYHARRDNDGVVVRSNVRPGSQASTEAESPASLPYETEVTKKQATTFAAYEVQP